MPNFLKGNYQLPKRKGPVTSRKRKAKPGLTEQFAATALSKLGGSLCFVMKKGTFIWSGPQDKPTRETSHYWNGRADRLGVSRHGASERPGESSVHQAM